MPLDKSIKKVLVIGSGPIVIGQAAEFDYSGTQACQAIKDEGIDVVLVNSNPATIMTDRGMATNTYIEPLTAEYVEKIIQKNVRTQLSPVWAVRQVLTLLVSFTTRAFLKSII